MTNYYVDPVFTFTAEPSTVWLPAPWLDVDGMPPVYRGCPEVTGWTITLIGPLVPDHLDLGARFVDGEIVFPRATASIPCADAPMVSR